jgi:polyisoprenoid-binding protein YceI
MTAPAASASQEVCPVSSHRGRRRSWLRWALVAAAVVVVLAVGGPFVYIHFIEGPAPAPLGLSDSASPGATASGAGSGQAAAATPLPGTWTVAAGSRAGYRVNEVLLGQDNVAVGRTNSVAGHLTIRRSTVTAGTFTVKMDTIRSDRSRRDAQFDGRIMDVATYPTGTFTLTRSIALAPVPASGKVRTYRATGNLTLHGHTRQVTFGLTAERTATQIRASGSIPVTFADWGIPNPSFAGFVTTENHGVMEFLLVLQRR